jgi:hypothetical protein
VYDPNFNDPWGDLIFALVLIAMCIGLLGFFAWVVWHG